MTRAETSCDLGPHRSGRLSTVVCTDSSQTATAFSIVSLILLESSQTTASFQGRVIGLCLCSAYFMTRPFFGSRNFGSVYFRESKRVFAWQVTKLRWKEEVKCKVATALPVVPCDVTSSCSIFVLQPSGPLLRVRELSPFQPSFEKLALIIIKKLPIYFPIL